MSAINHNLTDQELKDIRYALLALENKMYPNNPSFADEGSRQITIGVFRNLIQPDSVHNWIANKAREIFTVPVEKGHGNV